MHDNRSRRQVLGPVAGSGASRFIDGERRVKSSWRTAGLFGRASCEESRPPWSVAPARRSRPPWFPTHRRVGKSRGNRRGDHEKPGALISKSNRCVLLSSQVRAPSITLSRALPCKAGPAAVDLLGTHLSLAAMPDSSASSSPLHREIPAMRHLRSARGLFCGTLRSGLLLGLLATQLVPSAPAQTKSGWIGRRVITQFGTILKVGSTSVVDQERNKRFAISECDRGVFRLYHVERTSGPWLWLVAERTGVSGWARVDSVIPYEQGIDYITAEIRARPSASLYTWRGNLWHDRKEYDKAIADHGEAILLDPSYATAFNNRGNAWRAKKQYDKAIADYDEAVRLDSSYAMALNNRGVAWRARRSMTRQSPTSAPRSGSSPRSPWRSTTVPGSGPPARRRNTGMARRRSHRRLWRVS